MLVASVNKNHKSKCISIYNVSTCNLVKIVTKILNAMNESMETFFIISITYMHVILRNLCILSKASQIFEPYSVLPSR